MWYSKVQKMLKFTFNALIQQQIFHTATVRPKRSGPIILYNTPLRSYCSWALVFYFNTLVLPGVHVLSHFDPKERLMLKELTQKLLTLKWWKWSVRQMKVDKIFSLPLKILNADLLKIYQERKMTRNKTFNL